MLVNRIELYCSYHIRRTNGKNCCFQSRSLRSEHCCHNKAASHNLQCCIMIVNIFTLSPLPGSVVNFFPLSKLPGSVDLLHAVNIQQPNLSGITKVTGFCESRGLAAFSSEGGEEVEDGFSDQPDVAYNIKPRASLSVNVHDLFSKGK